MNTIKMIAAAALISTCALGQTSLPAACGPAGVDFKVAKDKSRHPTPAPANGKAALYLLGDGTIGLDGTWVGAVHEGEYSVVEINPGEHHLCSVYSPVITVLFLYWTKLHFDAAHSLNAEPGGTYYFKSTVPMRSTDFVLKQLDPDEGARLVEKATFSTSHPK